MYILTPPTPKYTRAQVHTRTQIHTHTQTYIYISMRLQHMYCQLLINTKYTNAYIQILV